MSVANDFYRAEMIIAPASPMGHGLREVAKTGEGSLHVQEGELQSNAAFLQFENIYGGASVATFLIQDKGIIFGLEFDRTFKFSKGHGNWSAETLSEYVKKRVRLEPVSGTPLRRMIYLHPNKESAVEMIKRTHRIADELIRARILVETKQRIDYLNASIVKITNPDHRRSLASLLMEQERLKMMVSLDQPYAASIVEPA